MLGSSGRPSAGRPPAASRRRRWTWRVRRWPAGPPGCARGCWPARPHRRAGPARITAAMTRDPALDPALVEARDACHVAVVPMLEGGGEVRDVVAGRGGPARSAPSCSGSGRLACLIRAVSVASGLSVSSTSSTAVANVLANQQDGPRGDRSRSPALRLRGDQRMAEEAHEDVVRAAHAGGGGGGGGKKRKPWAGRAPGVGRPRSWRRGRRCGSPARA